MFDPGRDEKTKKWHGRVFYAKGKSLILCAYDLDQETDLLSTGTFQAWGQPRRDGTDALNLGLLHVENSGKKRWVLAFDDSKALDNINAIFVTMEPDGGSRIPTGKPLLFAYLGEESYLH